MLDSNQRDSATRTAASARRAKLLALVRESGFRSSGELSQELGVSEMTVRRDIHQLAEEGLVQAVHGGASYGGASYLVRESMGMDFRLRSKQNAPAKRAVATRAVQMLREGDIIALDAGTTALEIARLIPAELKLSVITHSLPAMYLLAARSNVELIGLGGVYQPETQAFTGPVTVEALRHLRVQTTFVAAGAIRAGALYSANHHDAAVKRALIDVADEVVLVTDSSKFRTTAMVEVASLSQIATIICDSGIDTEQAAALENTVSQVVIVPVETGLPRELDASTS